MELLDRRERLDTLRAFIKRLPSDAVLSHEREPTIEEQKMSLAGTKVSDCIRASGLQELVELVEELESR